MDAGYKTPAIAKMSVEDGILPVLPCTRPKGQKACEHPYYKREYIFDEYYDCYLCPEGEPLNYSITDREGYRIYKSNPKTRLIGSILMYIHEQRLGSTRN